LHDAARFQYAHDSRREGRERSVARTRQVPDLPLADVDFDFIAFGKELRRIFQFEGRKARGDGIAESDPGSAFGDHRLHAPHFENLHRGLAMGTEPEVLAADEYVPGPHVLVEPGAYRFQDVRTQHGEIRVVVGDCAAILTRCDDVSADVIDWNAHDPTPHVLDHGHTSPG
jgi:hypothetical protein